MGYRVEASRFDRKSLVSVRSASTGCGDALEKQHLLKLWLPGRKNKILGKPHFKVGKDPFFKKGKKFQAVAELQKL